MNRGRPIYEIYHRDQYLPVPKPRKALTELVHATLPREIPSNAIIELVIVTDNIDLNAGEFSAYLNFIDRAYGRLTPRGLRSYVQNRSNQLRISAQKGSLQTVIEAVASHKEIITALVVLRFLLKYIPAGIKHIASAYRDLEEASLTRLRRKQIREQINADKDLATLEQNSKNKLVHLFDAVYQKEKKALSKVQRFTLYHVRSITIRVKENNDSGKD